MYHYKKAIPGNRYSIFILKDSTYALQDDTLQEVIATAEDANSLILYAQQHNMISAATVIIG